MLELRRGGSEKSGFPLSSLCQMKYAKLELALGRLAFCHATPIIVLETCTFQYGQIAPRLVCLEQVPLRFAKFVHKTGVLCCDLRRCSIVCHCSVIVSFEHRGPSVAKDREAIDDLYDSSRLFFGITLLEAPVKIVI